MMQVTPNDAKAFHVFTASPRFTSKQYEVGAVLTLYSVIIATDEVNSDIAHVTDDETEARNYAATHQGWYGSRGTVMCSSYVLAADGRWGAWHPLLNQNQHHRALRESGLAKLTTAERAALGLPTC